MICKGIIMYICFVLRENLEHLDLLGALELRETKDTMVPMGRMVEPELMVLTVTKDPKVILDAR